MAFESLNFVRGFIRMCTDGYHAGFHERNGGNASYRLTDDDIAALCACEDASSEGAFCELPCAVPHLSHAWFLVTATGSYMRNIADDPRSNLGVVALDQAGTRYRVVCGFEGGKRPTSEFAGHMLIHEARSKATNGASRVLYHAHPESIIALTKVLPLTAAAFSQALWRAMTECVMVFPEGVGVVGCMVPGSIELARASAEQMNDYAACVWAHHGLLATGVTFDDAFGRLHAIAKAAAIHNDAMMMCGGACDFPNTIDNTMLRAIAHSLHVTLNEALLEEA